MSSIIIEHVSLNELPNAWRVRLPSTVSKRVTVRIEEELEPNLPNAKVSVLAKNPLFGMWQDKPELQDVSAYMRQLRAPRF